MNALILLGTLETVNIHFYYPANLFSSSCFFFFFVSESRIARMYIFFSIAASIVLFKRFQTNWWKTMI